MEVSVPLFKFGAHTLPTTALLDVSCNDLISGTRLRQNGGSVFCAFDSARAVVATLGDDATSFRVLGVIFFRKMKSGRHALSITRTQQELLDVPEGVTLSPSAPSQETHVRITSETLIEEVALVNGCVVVASCGGLLGIVSLASLSATLFRAPVHGCVLADPALDPTDTFVLHRWAIDRDTSIAVRLSENAAVIHVIDENGSTATKRTRVTLADANISLAVDAISSAACFVDPASRENITVVINYTTSRTTTVLRLESSGGPYWAKRWDRASVSVPVDTNVFPRSEPSTLLRSISPAHAGRGQHGHLAATVYPDCVVFGTVSSTNEFSAAAMLKNELNLAFVGGCWESAGERQCRFLLFRCDAICLVYEVAFEVVPVLRIDEVALTSHQPIPFATATCMSGLSGRVLTVRSAEGLLGGDYACASGMMAEDNRDDNVGLVAALEEATGDYFRSLECAVRYNDPPTASQAPSVSMRLLEVLSDRHHDYSFLAVQDNGDCLLASTRERGRRHVATEENPLEVTSCLAFERADKSTVCVLGFRDGSVKVFVGDRFSCLVRMAHCGPVDKLVYFPDDSEAALKDAGFVSISTELGTICFHTGTKAEVTKTITSPSRPLTSCYVDRESGYLFAFSNTTGNLWHLPTCRLERAFTCSSGHLLALRDGMDDLLATPWTSTLGIRAFPFLGQLYYSIRVSVSKMVASLRSATTSTVEPDVSRALALLLRGCASGAAEDASQRLLVLTDSSAIVNVLEDLSLGVAPNGHVCPTLGAIALTSAIAELSPDHAAASHAAALCFRLQGELLGAPAQGAAQVGHALLSQFAHYFGSPHGVPTMTREGFRHVAACLSSATVEQLAARLAPQQQDGADNSGSTQDTVASGRYFAFIVTIVAARALGDVAPPSPGTMDSLCATAKRKCLQLLQGALSKSADERHGTSADAADLLGLAEGYAVFAKLPEMRDLVERLCLLCFDPRAAGSSLQDEAKQLHEEALSCITAANTREVVPGFIDRYMRSNPTWRTSIIIFLARFVKSFPSEAAVAFRALLEVALSATSSSSGPAASTERALVADATAQLVRVASGCLPNVSVQQYLQQVAVGLESGKVAVYNLKTAEVLTTFRAHKSAVACLSYSSSTLSHDIATVSASMSKVRVFRTQKPGSALVSFFSAASNEFKLTTEIELPPTDAALHERLLLTRFCAIKWLSPQCIQFSSPWHEKIQMTL